jgi:TolA-binding protein
MGEVVENVDKYLDYVVGEWMEENSIAIEAGIKVEMAESLMSGLKDLFSEHNVQIDEESFDAVSSLEAQVSDLEEQGNSLVNENIELQRQISAMNAASVFEGMTEGLSENQKERFKVLSEKLDVQDLEDYSNNLRVIKESFFGEGIPTAPKADAIEEEEIILEEQEVNKPASDYSSINALVEAFNTKKNN